ncbi:GerAB/ArcD/ProY family transporter [Cohnella soli]|uniref:Endospore germination permease n=1 Tax=Cohnella soli TaxID=425005 RepID=A0ABW0HYJ1_9BACL
MPDKEIISPRQLAILTFMMTVGPTILVAPALMASIVRQDGWIATICAICLQLLSVLLYAALGDRYPDHSIVEYIEIILGKWTGKAIALLYVLFCILTVGYIVRFFGDFMAVQVMPETPIFAVLVLFMVTVVVAVHLGLEVFARAAEVFFPYICALFVVLVVFSIPKADLSSLQPVLESGIKPMFLASINFFSLQETVILLALYPRVNQVGKSRNAMIMGVLAGGVVLILTTLMVLLVLGADMTARNIYPSYRLAQMISIGKFLQRVEAILAIIWFMTIFFKVVICFYAAVTGLSKTIGLREYKPFALPLGVISVILAMVVYDNSVKEADLIQNIWPGYALTFLLVVPLILLAVDFMRKKAK